MISEADKRWLKEKAMPQLGIRALALDWSNNKRTFPDIWCYVFEKPPRIVVTQEWAKQNTRERRKRLTHEIAGHLTFGWGHNAVMRKLGYTSEPSTDTMSWRIYKDIQKEGVRRPEEYLAQRRRYAT